MTTQRVASVWHEAGEQTPTEPANSGSQEYVEGALYAVYFSGGCAGPRHFVNGRFVPGYVAQGGFKPSEILRAEPIWTYDPATQVVVDKADLGVAASAERYERYAAEHAVAARVITARALRVLARALRAQEAQS